MARSAVDALARTGYTAKGIVYALVGALALQTAVGAGGQLTDSQGALTALGSRPGGALMLGMVALGLAAFVLWRGAQTLWDAEEKGALTRIGLGISGITYAALAVFAARATLGAGGGSEGGDTKATLASQLLSSPGGQLALGAIGLVVVGVGVYQLVKVWRADFMEEYDTDAMSSRERQVVETIGRVGYGARSVVFAIIGGFVTSAAIRYDPSQASAGLDEALQVLARQPHGVVLLTIVAAGLVAYGFYCFTRARWRHVPSS